MTEHHNYIDFEFANDKDLNELAKVGLSCKSLKLKRPKKKLVNRVAKNKPEGF